jgi:ABC-2 type transport system ATP-binding protein
MRALNGINLSIRPGITGLLGPNGAGKSTLIKVILGLVKTTSGSGTVMGYELGREGRAIRNKIGYMPEDDCYIPGMTGVEVVQFSACLAGLPIVEALRRAHEILDFSGMKQDRYRTIETYSTGMRQKVKFASAIVHDPEFLIFDEPTSGLDPEERETLLNRVQILAAESGKSVLISTHILPDVQAICDHAVILAHGQVRLNESLDVLNRPTSPTITVGVLGDPGWLIKGLERRGFQVHLQPDGRIRVSGNAIDMAQQIWQQANASSATIQSMTPARNSLEEIFVSVVEEGRHGDNRSSV